MEHLAALSFIWEMRQNATFVHRVWTFQQDQALWTASATQPGGIPESVEKSMLFVTADKQLAGAAEKEQLRVFNPELA